MTLVKLDQKMRLRIPKRLSKRLGLRGKETLDVEGVSNGLHVTKLKKFDFSDSPMLQDMIERPLHTKVKVTTELLEKMEDSMWMP